MIECKLVKKILKAYTKKSKAKKNYKGIAKISNWIH